MLHISVSFCELEVRFGFIPLVWGSVNVLQDVGRKEFIYTYSRIHEDLLALCVIGDATIFSSEFSRIYKMDSGKEIVMIIAEY